MDGEQADDEQTDGEQADDGRRLRVLITGAGSGLGAALADLLTERGADVLATDRDLRSVAHRPEHLALDITDPGQWAAARDRVLRQWGGLDLLVNNAGVAGGGRLDVAEIEEWRWIFEINLFGMVQGLRTFVPLLKEQRSGRILNVASLAGLVHPAGMASYNAVKAAVVALSETTGHELAAYGVTCAVACPSYFRTPLMAGARGADTALTQVMARLVEAAPLDAAAMAARVLDGLDAGQQVIIPDDAARAAVRLKQEDRAGYDAVLRRQAAKLDRF